MRIDASSAYLATQQTTAPRAQTSRAAEATTEAVALPELPPLRLLQGADLASATADFAADVGKEFRSAGIRVPPEPVLTTDFAGHVVVANDHPDKARIEGLFKDKPELRDRFAELSAAHSLQRAVENYDQFANDYARLQGNPDAQAALVNARIARNSAPFFMRIGSEGGEPFFGLGRVSA